MYSYSGMMRLGVGSVYDRNLVQERKLLENYSGKTVCEEDKQDIVNALITAIMQRR